MLNFLLSFPSPFGFPLSFFLIGPTPSLLGGLRTLVMKNLSSGSVVSLYYPLYKLYCALYNFSKGLPRI